MRQRRQNRNTLAVVQRFAWRLALTCWSLRLERLGNHFEDVAWCGKRWFGGWLPGRGPRVPPTTGLSG